MLFSKKILLNLSCTKDEFIKALNHCSENKIEFFNGFYYKCKINNNIVDIKVLPADITRHLHISIKGELLEIENKLNLNLIISVGNHIKILLTIGLFVMIIGNIIFLFANKLFSDFYNNYFILIHFGVFLLTVIILKLKFEVDIEENIKIIKTIDQD